MNRAVLLAVVALIVMIVMAAPTSAHGRDPFDPLISADTSTTTGADDDAGQTAAEPVVPAPDRERLAATGVPARELVGLALALMGLGAAALLAASARGPAKNPVSRRMGRVA